MGNFDRKFVIINRGKIPRHYDKGMLLFWGYEKKREYKLPNGVVEGGWSWQAHPYTFESYEEAKAFFDENQFQDLSVDPIVKLWNSGMIAAFDSGVLLDIKDIKGLGFLRYHRRIASEIQNMKESGLNHPKFGKFARNALRRKYRRPPSKI